MLLLELIRRVSAADYVLRNLDTILVPSGPFPDYFWYERESFY